MILAPAILRGELEVGAVNSFASVFMSMKLFLLFVSTNFSTLAGIKTKAMRLEALHRALGLLPGQAKQRIDLEINVAKPNGPLLQVQNLQVVIPHQSSSEPYRLGYVPGDGPGSSFEVSPREAVLLQGPSGVGKSSLLRSIAGIWDSGSGRIRCGTRNVFFLPQLPYLPAGDLTTASTLREQLLFPRDPSRTPPSESALLAALGAAGLGGTKLASIGGLSAKDDWAARLSGGERQRLAFARLFLQLNDLCVDEPPLVLLDEATAACDETAEAELYEELLRQLTPCCGTLVSVGHRSSLQRFHTKTLQMLPDSRSALQMPP